MDVFSLRESLVDDYERFARSFTDVWADDLRSGINSAYASGRYWPPPLVQINPRYQLARSTKKLAETDQLDPICELVQ